MARLEKKNALKEAHVQVATGTGFFLTAAFNTRKVEDKCLREFSPADAFAHASGLSA